MGLAGMGFNLPLVFNSLEHALNGLVPFHVMQDMKYITGVHTYHNEWSEYIGPATAGTSNGWVLTETAAGAGNTNSVAIGATPPGVLTLTTDNGANDLENLQRTVADYAYVVGKESGFFAVINPGATLTSLDLLFGLCTIDTSLIASAPADGLFFRKLAAASVFSFLSIKTGVGTTTVATVDQEVVEASVPKFYGFTVDAAGAIHVWWGDAFNGIRRVGGIAAGDANLPTNPLALSFSIRTTTTSSRAMGVGTVAYWRQI